MLPLLRLLPTIIEAAQDVFDNMRTGEIISKNWRCSKNPDFRSMMFPISLVLNLFILAVSRNYHVYILFGNWL